MEALWFSVVCVVLVVYAVRNGFDLGAGVIQLVVARTESERREVIAAAEPFWEGNVVWLLVAGAALYCTFPGLYGSREFYLAVMALVCLSVLRGFGMEFRNRVEGRDGRRMLDWAFGLGSMLLGLVPGIAAGYVIRGGEPDWFPMLCGVFGLACLTLESAAWMALKSTGELQVRCRRLASNVWWAVLLGCGGVVAARLVSQPERITGGGGMWLAGLAILALAGMILARLCLSVGLDLGVLAGASCVIAGLVAGTAAEQFPILVSAWGASPHGTIVSTIGVSALWWIPAIATVYSASAFASRHSSAVLRSASVSSSSVTGSGSRRAKLQASM